VSDPNLVYSAQINATTGSRTDSGTSGVAIRSLPPLPGLITLTRPKKQNDNDDDEACP
jgi:hypothetical protein